VAGAGFAGVFVGGHSHSLLVSGVPIHCKELRWSCQTEAGPICGELRGKTGGSAITVRKTGE
jgi:hypothetical protein